MRKCPLTWVGKFESLKSGIEWDKYVQNVSHEILTKK